MAATSLTIQSAPPGGLLIAYSTPTQTTGHSAPVGADCALLIKNASGSPVNVDIHVVKTGPGGLSVATPAAAAAPSRRVAAAVGDTLIPLDEDVYDNGSGRCTFDLASTTSITMAAVRNGS